MVTEEYQMSVISSHKRPITSENYNHEVGQSSNHRTSSNLGTSYVRNEFAIHELI